VSPPSRGGGADCPTVARPGNIRDALRCPNCWLTALQHVAGFGLGISSGTWITVYLLREFRLPLELSGLLGSVLLILAVLARPLGGLLLAREHMPTRRVMRLGDLAIVVGVALLAFPDRRSRSRWAEPSSSGSAWVFPTPRCSTPRPHPCRSTRRAQGLAAIGAPRASWSARPAMGYAVQTFGFWAAVALRRRGGRDRVRRRRFHARRGGARMSGSPRLLPRLC